MSLEMSSFAARLREALSARNMTQAALAHASGLSKSSISRYLSGAWQGKQAAVHALAAALNVSESWLIGYDVPMERLDFTVYPEPPQLATPQPPVNRLPLLHNMVHGENLLDPQNTIAFLPAPAGVRCDFFLRCPDDSMAGAGLRKGDTVFLRAQNTVESGEIAAVRTGNKITLRYAYLAADRITLVAADSAYPPDSFADTACGGAQIIGRAVGYLHLF